MGKVVAQNKDAFFNYELIDKYEAGLVLEGWEIKSIRAGKVQIKGSFVSFKQKEPFVSNMHIAQYMNVATDETRARKLLLHQSQIKKLQVGLETKSMTVVPLRVKLSRDGIAKLEIALARGKSKSDKREVIKRKEAKRKIKNYL